MIGLLFIPFQIGFAAPVQKTQWLDRFLSSTKKIIIIDSGHGGTDPGSVKQWVQEKILIFNRRTHGNLGDKLA